MDKKESSTSPSEPQPELFSMQFFRYLLGFETSGPSETRFATADQASPEVPAGPATPMYTVQMPSFTSVSSIAASEDAQRGDTGAPRVRQGPSTDTLASGTAPTSRRAITAIRTARFLGAPVVYYALILGSLGICAVSYPFAMKTVLARNQKAGSVGDAISATKAGHGALLSAPAPSPEAFDSLATGNEEPGNDAAASGHRHHHKKHRKKTKQIKRLHRSARPVRHRDSQHRRKSIAATSTKAVEAKQDSAAPTSPAAAARRLVPEAEAETSGDAERTSTATTVSPPPPRAPAHGATPENKMLLNSSANPDLYQEVFEYYYLYDDNGTLSSSAP